MATLEDINRQMEQERNSYNMDLNRLRQNILDRKSRHQSTMEMLKAEKERIKQQNKQLESYNKVLSIAMGY